MEANVVQCGTTCARPVWVWGAAARCPRPSPVQSHVRVSRAGCQVKSLFLCGKPLPHFLGVDRDRNAKLPLSTPISAVHDYVPGEGSRPYVPRSPVRSPGAPTGSMSGLARNITRWVGAASLALCCAVFGGIAAPPPAHARAGVASYPHADTTTCHQLYVVRRGDTLSIIADKVGVTVERLSAANGGILDDIDVGQVLHVPAAVPTPVTAATTVDDSSRWTLRNLLKSIGVPSWEQSEAPSTAKGASRASLESRRGQDFTEGSSYDGDVSQVNQPDTRQRSLLDSILHGRSGGGRKQEAEVDSDVDNVGEVGHSRWDVQRYRVLLLFESNPFAKLWALFAMSFLLWSIGTTAYARVSTVPVPEAMYKAFAYLSGGAGSSLDDEDWGAPRAVSGGLFLIGLVVFATLTGLLGDIVSSSMDELRKGKHPVLEQQHTLVLGWNESVPQLVQGLVTRSSTETRNKTVVVLADKDVEDMKDAVSEVLSAKGTESRIVYRQGDPGSRHAQSWVASAEAHSVVVMAGESESEEEIALQSLRTVLATKANYEKSVKDAMLGNRAPAPPPRVVVQTTSPSEHELVRMCQDKRTPFDVRSIPASSLMKRHLAQCSVQPNGLAALTRQLLSFNNASFFMERVPAVAGTQFADVLSMFPDAAPCGLFENNSLVFPRPDYVMKKEDKLVLLANERKDIRPAARPALPKGMPWESRLSHVRPIRLEKPSRVLIINWFEGIGDMLKELDDILDPGSVVTVLADRPRERMVSDLSAHGFRQGLLRNTLLRLVEGSPQSQDDLERVDPASFASIILLCSGDVAGDGTVEGGATADTHNLSTLVRLRQIMDTTPYPGSHRTVPITVEVQASPTRKLVKSVYKGAQTVIGPQMTALLLAQASVSTDTFNLWRDLLDTQGKEIYHKPVLAYAAPGEKLSWHQLVRRAYEEAEVMPFGYMDKRGQYVLNPRDKSVPFNFCEEAMYLVVLSDQ
eukprot:jgi/Mesvir1/21295/Mv21686-RA.1